MRQIKINACSINDILGMASIREIVKALVTHGTRTWSARFLFARLAGSSAVYAPVVVCVDHHAAVRHQRLLKRQTLGLLRSGLWRPAGAGSSSGVES